jgi:hypothetical protein
MVAKPSRSDVPLTGSSTASKEDCRGLTHLTTEFGAVKSVDPGKLGLMPTPTEDELAKMIAAGQIGAITVDTSVFDKYRDDLRNKVLLGLKQFVGTSIKVVFSDIVISEVKGHIARRAAETTIAVRKELKNHRQAWGREESLEELGASAHLNDHPDELAERHWRIYSATIQAGTLAADDLVRIKDLTARYFASSPPFSGTGKKKAEFPDATALLSLEAWAKSRYTKLLVISSDDDWRSFAAQSGHLVWLADVPEALDHFNREARFVADRTIALLQGQEISDASNEIANAVERFFDDSSMDIEAITDPYGYEAELQGGALQFWTVKCGPLILTQGEEEVTFVVELDCKVSFEASFAWSFYSGGEWHEIDPSTIHTTENGCVLQFTITCSRIAEEEPEIYDVAVTSRPFTIDFGYVEPGWDYEE